MKQLDAAEGSSITLDAIRLYHSPSIKPSTSAGGSGRRRASRQRRSNRASLACDVCRFNHRKCPGPAPDSNDCIRCITMHKLCTWTEHQSRASIRPSTSASPQPLKIRKISIRRSKSLPSPLQPQPSSSQQRLPLLEDSAPPSSPIRSSSEEQGPVTPVEAHQTLPYSTDKDANPVQASENVVPHLPAEQSSENFIPHFPHFPAEQSTAPQEPAQPQPEPAPALPEWFLDCLALADKHNLLLFPMPLLTWEERQQRRDGDPHYAAGLRCAVPSDIHPLPTLEEAVEMLDCLSLDMRLFPDAYAAFRNSINARLDQQRQQVDSSSDEETLADSAFTSRNSVSGPSSSTPPLPPTQANDQNIDIIVDDLDMDVDSEPEPDFSIDLTSDTPASSQFATTSPYRHKAGRDQFDAFLYSPCQCQAAQPAQLATPHRMEAEDPSVDNEIKDELASWEEVMPDVLNDASLESSVEEYLCIEEEDLLD